MSLNTPATNVRLDSEGAFAVTLLATCEITKNLLLDRCGPGDAKRRYWLERMDKDIEGINRTYPGYLDDDFQERARIFHEAIEKAAKKLLSGYEPRPTVKRGAKGRFEKL